MWRGPRTEPEGSWQPAFGFGEFGTTFEIPFGDGFQRNLTGPGAYSCLTASACVNAYVGALASCGLDHVRHLKGGGTEILTDSPIARVLRYPNFLQQQSQWLAYIVSSLATTGNFYVYANERDARNIPTSLMPLTPHHRRAVLSDDRSALWYDVSPDRDFFVAGNVESLVPAREVAHGKLASHRSLLVGESPLAEAGYTLALNQGLLASSSEFIRNMARPSGIISIKDTLTASQMAELREKFNEYSRGPNAGKVPVLGSSADTSTTKTGSKMNLHCDNNTAPGRAKDWWTAHNGQPPAMRAKGRPVPSSRSDTLPAGSTRIRKNGTPLAVSRCKVVSRCAACSKLTSKAAAMASTSWRNRRAVSRNRV